MKLHIITCKNFFLK